MPTIEQHVEEGHALLDEKDLIDHLRADADDRAAQLAMAIESIADEIGQLRRHVEELRADAAEQRQVLDELKAIRRQVAAADEKASTVADTGRAGVGLVLGGGLGGTGGLILGALPGLLVGTGVGTTLGLLVGAVVGAVLARPD